MTDLNTAELLLAVCVIGSVCFSLFMLWLAIRLSGHECDEIEGTELSPRNEPYPPYYGPRLVK